MERKVTVWISASSCPGSLEQCSKSGCWSGGDCYGMVQLERTAATRTDYFS